MFIEKTTFEEFEEIYEQSTMIVPNLTGHIHFIISILLEYKIYDQNKTVIMEEIV